MTPYIVRYAGSGGPSSFFNSRATPQLLCGFTDDQAAHIPANYTTFTPPTTVGGSYVDALTGCTVTLVAKNLTQIYSLSECFNSNDTFLFVRNPDANAFQVISVSGAGVVVPPGNMPSSNSLGQPLWTFSDPNSWYYPSGAAIMKATITGLPSCAASHNCTVTTSTIHDFTGTYSGINFPGDYDLSTDGDHIAFAAQTAVNTNVIVSVWSLSVGSESNTYTIPSCSVADVTTASQPGCLHRLQIDPLNRLILDIGARVLESGGTTTQLYDSSSSAHSETGLDINGNPIYIAVHNPGPNGTGTADACNGNGGVSYLTLSGLVDHCLYAVDYAADHVSYRGGPSQPWVMWDAGEGCNGSSLFNNDSNFVAPTTTIGLGSGQCPTEGDWRPYAGSIVLTNVSTIGGTSSYFGSPASVIIAHHRSRNGALGNYWAQPRSDLSRSGKYVAFTSNMEYISGSCTLDNCVNTYVVGPLFS